MQFGGLATRVQIASFSIAKAWSLLLKPARLGSGVACQSRHARLPSPCDAVRHRSVDTLFQSVLSQLCLDEIGQSCFAVS